MSKERPRSLPKNRNAQCKFASFDLHQNHLKGLLKHKLLGPPHSGVEWGPRVTISNRFFVKPVLLV